jgi:hypothetical protein
MRAYRLTITVIDFDEMGPQAVAETIENQRYPNHCISTNVRAIESVDLGEWSDDHRANYRDWDVSAEEWEACE